MFRRTLGIASLASYLIAFAVASVAVIVMVLPGAPDRAWLGSASDEARYMLMVIAGGALGSVVHALTSLADYVGNQRLVSSWTLWYITRVFVGSFLAFIFYLVIRAGLLAPAADVRSINAFGVIALSVLIGMFSKQALDKIGEVAGVLFRSEQLQQGIQQITDALGVSTLDNYQGFLCLSIQGEDGTAVSFSEDKVPLLEAGQSYDLVLWFQPDQPTAGAFEEISLSGGLDVVQTQFTLAPNSDSLTLRPHKANVTVIVKQISDKQKFKFTAPPKADPYELWVEISQKTRLLQVASLTFVVHSQVKSPESSDQGGAAA